MTPELRTRRAIREEQALVWRLEGQLFREIGAKLGVSVERARVIVNSGKRARINRERIANAEIHH